MAFSDTVSRVTLDNLSDIERILFEQLAEQNELQSEILKQLKLLNARFEEMAETLIDKEDVED